MKVAVISDIHGNAKLLKKFISYIDEQKIDLVLNLGDILEWNESTEVLDIIMKDNRFISVCGNHDSNLFLTNKELTKQQKKWLKRLPLTRIIKLKDKKFLMLHSRINSNKDIPLLYNEGLLMDFLRDYEGDYDYVLFGHTHYQCLLQFYEGKVMINPGSLGMSYDKKMNFAIIEINDKNIDVIMKKVDN